MAQNFLACDREQSFLLPPDLRDWLPEVHLAWFVVDVVGVIDLSGFYGSYREDGLGRAAYEPSMMVALILYCWSRGMRSSRRIERACMEDVACRVIAANQRPDHATIARFIERHQRALADLFGEVLVLCADAGLATVGVVAIDGTKVAANANRDRTLSYEQIAQAIVEEAIATDAAEDAEFGDRRGDELPEELARRQGRLQKIRQAKAALEAEARQQARAEEAERQRQGKPPSGKGPEQARPEPKAQYNFTDPESQVMKVSNKGWDQCINAEVVVNEHQIIVAADVTDEANDKQQVRPMVEQMKQNLAAVGVRERAKEMVADSGFYSEANVAYLEAEGIDPYIATERLKHHERIAAPRGRCPQGLTAKQRMARKLRTKRGRQRYARRKAMVEPVFGQIKHGRGFRQHLLRGRKKMRAEWRLVSLTHNLLKLWRYEQSKEE